MAVPMKKCLALCLTVALAGWSVIIPESLDTWVRMDISKLELALASFGVEFDVRYVPSRIKLSETCDYPLRDRPCTLDHDSVTFLKRLWPQISLGPGTRIDWNGDGRVEGDWTQEGDECLVFFLGGDSGQGQG